MVLDIDDGIDAREESKARYLTILIETQTIF